MLRNISIKELYVLALAEGEGVGTAYEYFAKRLTLARWLKGGKRPSSILIAGLPQKYGTSLDFLQLADELGAAVTIADERPFALEKLQGALQAAQKEGWLTAVSPTPGTNQSTVPQKPARATPSYWHECGLPAGWRCAAARPRRTTARAYDDAQ